MATAAQIVVPVRAAGPLALWHLMSLDAPTVAAVWTWSVARAAHVRLPVASPLAMALAVWALYAGDRLLDARLLGARGMDARGLSAGAYDQLEARPFFHRAHRRAFLLGIAIAALAVAALLPSLDPAAVRLYLVEGGLLLGWFIVLHATRGAHRLPKEIAVGFFFSAAIFIPTVAREPSLRVALLPCAILFAGLCGLNCLFIYAWEHEVGGRRARGSGRVGTRTAHATTRLALAHLNALAVGAAIAGAGLAIVYLRSAANVKVWLVPGACGLSAYLLLALHRERRRLSRVDLRAAADLALLTPLLLLPFQR
jgi:hypothetical protein